MDTGKISTRYAKALYAYASELKEEDRLYEEMKSLISNFYSFKSLNKIMQNPTVSPEEKQKLLITAGGITVSKAYLGMLQTIKENQRESYMFSIALMYQEYYRKEKGMVIGILTTTDNASEEQKEKLKNMIAAGTNQKVDLITKTDENLIGGFILQIESNLLDASIKNQLNKIKLQLTNS